MAGVEVCSFTNYLPTVATPVGTFAEQAAWPASYLLRPDEPLLVYRSPTGASPAGLQLIYDLGSARTINLVAMVNTNAFFAQFTVADNAALTTNAISSGVITTRYGPTGRAAAAYIFPTAPSKRYVGFNFGGATYDGNTYYSCGGFWAGPTFTFPVGIHTGWELAAREPVSDVRGVGDGPVARLAVGDPYTVITAKRFGTVSSSTLGVSDDLQEWTFLDVSMRANPAFGFFLNFGNPGQFWVVRRMGPPAWSIDFPRLDAPLVLEEVVFP